MERDESREVSQAIRCYSIPHLYLTWMNVIQILVQKYEFCSLEVASLTISIIDIIVNIGIQLSMAIMTFAIPAI